MSRRARTGLVLLTGAAVGVVLILAVLRMPAFGGTRHPYRDHAVPASVSHVSANVISSINFDQRGLDTLGEESILLASVIGVSMLLRPAEDEEESADIGGGRVLDSTRLGGYVLLPITIVIGFNVVSHGHLGPGGGFQGGVVLGTGLHLLYVAGRFQALARLRPLTAFEWGEALGAGAFAAMGVAGVLVAGSFLADIIPNGTLGNLLSAGTVPVLNGAVGIEVASGVMVLLGKFLEQAILIGGRGGGGPGGGGYGGSGGGGQPAGAAAG